MSQEVQEALEEPRFEVVVPFNNELMIERRKKNKIVLGVLLLIFAVIFVVLAVLSGLPVDLTTIIFGLCAILTASIAIFCLCTLKPNSKNDNKKIVFSFYQDYLHIFIDNALENKKNKELKACLYRPYKNKQYINKITEDAKKIDIKIFTGTYNGAPQYESHIIPLSVFNETDELNAFKEFLNQQVNKYVIK